MSKTVNIYFVLNNQNFKKVLQISKTEAQDGEYVTVFDVEEFKKQIRKIHISGDVVDYAELDNLITESFNVRIFKRAFIIECEAEIEISEQTEELKVEIDLRNCKTRDDVAAAFKEATGNDFEMDYDDDLEDCENLSSAVVFYSKNYISIDNKNGHECYYNEICDDTSDSVNLYFFNQINKVIEENKKLEKTSYWGEQYIYPNILENIDYKIWDKFEKTDLYEALLRKAEETASEYCDSWIEIDIEKLKEYTCNNSDDVLYVVYQDENDLTQNGFSLCEETHQYQKISPVFYRNEICQNFEIYKRDDDGNFINEDNEYIVAEITNFCNKNNIDLLKSQFIFCDEDGDELSGTQRKDVILDEKLNIPENCFIIQILGLSNPLIRD